MSFEIKSCNQTKTLIGKYKCVRVCCVCVNESACR